MSLTALVRRMLQYSMGGGYIAHAWVSNENIVLVYWLHYVGRAKSGGTRRASVDVNLLDLESTSVWLVVQTRHSYETDASDFEAVQPEEMKKNEKKKRRRMKRICLHT